MRGFQGRLSRSETVLCLWIPYAKDAFSEPISRKMIEGQITALIRKCVYRIERIKNQLFFSKLMLLLLRIIQRHSEDKS